MKQMKLWSIIMLIGMLLSVTVACEGGDDDNNGKGESSYGKSSIAINENIYYFNYAYYNYIRSDNGGEYHITFYEKDIKKMHSAPDSLTALTIGLMEEGDKNILPTGEFDDFYVGIIANEKPKSSEGHTIYSGTYYGDTNSSPEAKVIINKSGYNYSVELFGLDIFTMGTDFEKLSQKLSFSYTGSIILKESN